jgi:hypothetical protein
MAITGTKLFNTGDVLTASDTNQYLMRGVKVFADATARDAAYGGAGEPTLEEGEACYLSSTNEVLAYDGSAWRGVTGGEILVASATFSAVSILNIDNVFTSAYRHYALVLEYQTSGINNINAQLRVGGVAAATNYNVQTLTSTGATTTSQRSTALTVMPTAYSTDGAFVSQSLMYIWRPAIASATGFLLLGGDNYQAFTVPVVRYNSGNHSTATAYDGIGLSVAGGQTMTGRYSIYGMRE